MTVNAREHVLIDYRPPHATLFLHEDLVAKTLQFERELKEWRLAEVQAGWQDRHGQSLWFGEGQAGPT